MLVKFLGISFKTGKGITFDDFAEHLCSLHEREFEFGNKKRHFLFQKDPDKPFYNGALITIKDHKKYCELAGSKILVQQIAEDRDLMDFNFFCIKEGSNNMMYQYYHNSCSSNLFGMFLREQYNHLKDEKIALDISKLSDEDKLVKKRLKEISRKYSYGLKWALLVKPENLSQILATLKRIKSFEYYVATQQAKNRLFAPLTRHANTVKHKFSFKRDTVLNHVISAITKGIDDEGIKKGTVRGEDHHGILRKFDIFDNPDHFAEFDFDRLVAQMDEFDFNDISKNWLTEKLQEDIDKNNHIFRMSKWAG